MTALSVTPERVAEALEAVRARAPRIHCITNTVAQTYTANTLLAIGAIPSMTIAPDEVGGFAAMADGLLINLGTLDQMRRDAIGVVLPIIEQRSCPWALDPAHAESSENRAVLARSLVGRRPSVLRCNGVEFEMLTGKKPEPDEVATVAKNDGLTVALTGAEDIVADPVQMVRVGNGHALQTRVTAAGCAATAVIAAFLATDTDGLTAAVAGLVTVGLAAEIAGETAAGPGSLQIGFLDELYRLTPQTIIDRARIG